MIRRLSLRAFLFAFLFTTTLSAFAQMPTITTNAASAITANGARLNGTARSNSDIGTSVSFQYGPTTSYGQTVTGTPSAVTGSSNTAVYANISGLNAATTYHFRLVGSKDGRTVYGGDMTFTTTTGPPIVSTGIATGLTLNQATLNGTVNANGASTTVTFDYGLTAAYGSTATAIQSPVSGSANTAVSSTISGLSPDTTYHFRVVGVNTNGTTNGTDMTFTTPDINLSINNASVNEPSGPATFTVSLSFPSTDVVTVNYATADNTAQAGTDYTAVASSLTFLPGEQTKTLTVPILNDSTYEGSESFYVNLSGAVNASISDSQGIGTIYDYEDRPTISINDVTVSEDAAMAVFTVTLSNASAFDTQVNYATANGTATAGSDYTATSGTLVISAGSVIGSIVVPILEDMTYEGNQVFYVNLSVPVNATISDNQGVGTIVDDDPQPAISINDVTVDEGNAAVFTVHLSNPSEFNTGLNYNTSDGTATGGTDYMSTTGDLVFSAGETSRTVSVPTTDDMVYEGTENFQVHLSNPTNATIQDDTGIGTILDNDPMPQIAIDDVTVTEGNTATFTISLSNPSSSNITVSARTMDDTAESGTDYVANTVAFTFLPGQTSKSFPVDTTPDNTYEGTESFIAELFSPSGATIADMDGWGTILDSDPVPTVTIADASSEEGGVLTFIVTQSNRSAFQSSVNFETVDGNARVADSDYSFASGTLAIPPGDLTGTISVQSLDDTEYELDERFSVELSGASNCFINDLSARGTILDNEPDPEMSINNAPPVAETDAGTTDATFTVTLSFPSPKSVTVNYATTDGTATAGDDYTGSSGTLTIHPGQFSRTISVPVLGDLLNEFSESFTLTLSNPVNATLADPVGTAYILDNDPFPTFSINNASILEGDSGTGDIEFTVTLSAPSGRTVTVDYGTVGGTAASGVDFTATSGTLTFAPGTTTGTISIPILGDRMDESDEDFTVNLSNPTHAAILDGTGIGSILDNDPPPTVSISDTSVAEGDSGTTPMIFTVSLSNPSDQSITVYVATSDGTATVSDNDYIAHNAIVTFPPGETTRAVQVEMVGDRDIETDETFQAVVFRDSSLTVQIDSATGTIINDDWYVTVSGTVTDRGNPLSGVTMTFSHDGHTEVTAADGSYSYTFMNSTDTTVTPDHFMFESWIPPVATFTDIQADQTADFEGLIKRFDITVTETGNGTVTPNGVVSVIYGEDQYFTFTPDPGYRIAEVWVDGSPARRVDHYWFADVTEHHSLEVIFGVDEPPIIDSLTASQIAGNAVLNVTFTALAHDPDTGPIIRYLWDISGRRADRTMTRSGVLDYRFVVPGDYTLTLTVMDDERTLSDPASLDIHVGESTPVGLPVPSMFDFAPVKEKVDLDVAVHVINVFDETAEVELQALDSAGQVLETTLRWIPPFGSAYLETDWVTVDDACSIRAVADRYVIVYADAAGYGVTTKNTLNTDLQSHLVIPHIAEDTDFWDTLTFLSNADPQLLSFDLAGTTTSLCTCFSHVYDLEAFMAGEPDSASSWGTFAADARDPFTDTRTLTGFELFVKEHGDGAAVKLSERGATTLFIPHIANNTALFWTGYAFVNTGDEPVVATFTWLGDDGSFVGTNELEILPGHKVKGLQGDLFPESGAASWGVMAADGELTGVQLFGTLTSGICGIALPHMPHANGVLPAIEHENYYWTGITITNVMDADVSVTLQLVGKDGVVKGTSTETLNALSRFKAVVADYFPDATLAAGDYIRFNATGPVVAIQISGRDDNRMMSALSATR